MREIVRELMVGSPSWPGIVPAIHVFALGI
jgi:hypothetical protein